MGWHGTSEAVGAGAQWKRRQTKAQECQMEIMLHSPRGTRHVINTGYSRWLGSPRGTLMFSRDPTKATGPGTEHQSDGVWWGLMQCCCLITLNLDKLNKNDLKIETHYKILYFFYCYHETTDKLLAGGIVLLIHSIEQMSQQFLARGRLVYCNYIGKEVSIEC